MKRNDNSKKTYTRPSLSTHKLEIGVFGDYCNDNNYPTGGTGGWHWR